MTDPDPRAPVDDPAYGYFRVQPGIVDDGPPILYRSFGAAWERYFAAPPYGSGWTPSDAPRRSGEPIDATEAESLRDWIDDDRIDQSMSSEPRWATWMESQVDAP